MVKRLAAAAALVALAAGCGGSGGNAAVSKQFSYGAPSSASSTQATSLDSSISTTASQSTSLSASEAQSFGATSSVTSSLLGDTINAYTTSIAGSSASAKTTAGRTALVRVMSAAATSGSGGFDDPACATVTATSVTMKSCAITSTDANGTLKVTANGSISKTSAGALTWDVSVGINLTGTSSSGSSVSINETSHQAGTLTYTSTSLKGSMLSELKAQVSSGNVNASVGVDESVDVDVTFSGSPACVTGGTLEAKRVWTQRPNGANSTQLPDAAAKITWTGCGTATIAVSH